MLELERFDVEQGTPEWHECRRGIPTASEFGAVLAKGRSKSEGLTRRRYLLDIAGEIITGKPCESWSGNRHTERGKALEPEARRLYAFIRGVDVDQVGFYRRGRVGASPDGTVISNGSLEIKTKLPALHLDILDRQQVPPEHMPQIQGVLWVTGREWCDFMSYCPGIQPFIKRVYRDEQFIAELAIEIASFNAEVDAIVARFGNQ